MCISSADIAGRRCSAKNRRPEVSSNSTPPTSSPPCPTATEKASGLALHRDGPAFRRGRLVADAGKRDWDELTAEYGAMLMEGLSVRGTAPRLATCLRLQIRLQCIRFSSPLDYVAASRHMNPYPLGGSETIGVDMLPQRLTAVLPKALWVRREGWHL